MADQTEEIPEPGTAIVPTDIQRFRPSPERPHAFHEDADGVWVRHSDHRAALADARRELAALRSRIEKEIAAEKAIANTTPFSTERMESDRVIAILSALLTPEGEGK